MTQSEAEAIVCSVYKNAHVVISNGDGALSWAVSTGMRTYHGPILIPGVGWHPTAEAALIAAAKVVQATSETAEHA